MKKNLFLAALLGFSVTASANFLNENGVPTRDIQMTLLGAVEQTEGMETKTYNLGKPTIGKGSCYHIDGTPVKMGDTIAPELVDSTVLVHFRKGAYPTIKKLVERELNEGQYMAVSMFIYWTGEGNFQKSALLRSLNNGDDDYTIVLKMAEYTNSKKIKKMNLPGLYNSSWFRMALFVGKLTPEQINELPPLAIYSKPASFFYVDKDFTTPDLSDEKVQEFLDHCATLPKSRVKAKVKVKEVILEEKIEEEVLATIEENTDEINNTMALNTMPASFIDFISINNEEIFSNESTYLANLDSKLVSYSTKDYEVEVDANTISALFFNTGMDLKETDNIQIEITVIKQSQSKDQRRQNTMYVSNPDYNGLFNNNDFKMPLNKLSSLRLRIGEANRGGLGIFEFNYTEFADYSFKQDFCLHSKEKICSSKSLNIIASKKFLQIIQ